MFLKIASCVRTAARAPLLRMNTWHLKAIGVDHAAIERPFHTPKSVGRIVISANSYLGLSFLESVEGMPNLDSKDSFMLPYDTKQLPTAYESCHRGRPHSCSSMCKYQ